MRLGILTDIHHCPPGSPPDGWHNQHQFADVGARLERSIRWLENEGVDRLAVLGDLTHFGDQASMREVIGILGQSKLPCWILPGNHDLTPDGSVLVEALASCGATSIELIDRQPIQFGPSWIAAGLEMERAGNGVYQASSEPDVAGWGDAPVLVLSHFPVLSLQAHCADAGLKYAGDLVNRDPVGAAVLSRKAPTLVIHGHLHVRHVVTDGSVLQASCGAQVESLFEATIVDFGAWDEGRVTWTATPTQAVDPGVQPVLSEREQAWTWDGATWRS